MARNADGAPAALIHEVLDEPFGVPYFRAVQGPDGRWHWAQCPRCGEVVRNTDGYGPGRHWLHRSAAEMREGAQ